MTCSRGVALPITSSQFRFLSRPVRNEIAVSFSFGVVSIFEFLGWEP